MLASLSDLKYDLEITDTSQDLYLTKLLKYSSDLIEKYCNTQFGVRELSQKFRCVENKGFLITKHYPVAKILSIVADGVVLTLNDYELQAESGMIFRLSSNGSYSCWNAQVVDVSYKCGYNTPDATADQDAQSLPMDIQRVCLDIASSQYYDRQRDPSLRSVSVQDVESRTFFDRNQSNFLTDLAKEILDLYRRLGEI